MELPSDIMPQDVQEDKPRVAHLLKFVLRFAIIPKPVVKIAHAASADSMAVTMAPPCTNLKSHT